jgi:hypothetical protein
VSSFAPVTAQIGNGLRCLDVDELPIAEDDLRDHRRAVLSGQS